MMYALYEEAGKFQAGRLMSDADSSVQVELDSGKRVKVKAAHVLLRFDKPDGAGLLAQARELAAQIDIDLAWEFAPQGDFGFAELAREYFDASAGSVQLAATLLRLYEAPHYFRRVGKGVFRKAPAETVKAALHAIERKRQQAAQVEDWAEALVRGECPPPVRDQLYRILFKPDKNSLEYKAVVAAAQRSHRAPLDLLEGAGAIDSAYQFHWRRFLFEQFPKGAGFPALGVPPLAGDPLPVAPLQAFSIDDSHTTEIDDALSVQGLGTGHVTLGVHIAAPGLALLPGSPADQVARERLSTVYMPGWKLTMLPDDIVQAYTLTEGRACPAVSLYVTFDEATLAIESSSTALELVPIAVNLRHDRLDDVITEASLVGQAQADYPFATELAFAFRLARHLKAGREKVRGRPEMTGRPDYTFRLESPTGGEPDGSEQVAITARQRGAPLDLIVSEAMILANSTWGSWLAEHGVPGIYRSQAALAPGIKVRMGTKAQPHAGLGVPAYAWSTSPLRRYVDLVNQWQIIACARHGRTAALAAPFKPRDASLMAIVSNFDAAYTAYNGFQSTIERFWTLRWLQQQAVQQLDAAMLHDGLVRALALPLVFRVAGTEGLARGTHVRVRVEGCDLLTLEVHARLLARLDEKPLPAEIEEDVDAEAADTEMAAPLALAIDVAEPAVEDPANGVANAATADGTPRTDRPSGT